MMPVAWVWLFLDAVAFDANFKFDRPRPCNCLWDMAGGTSNGSWHRTSHVHACPIVEVFLVADDVCGCSSCGCSASGIW